MYPLGLVGFGNLPLMVRFLPGAMAGAVPDRVRSTVSSDTTHSDLSAPGLTVPAGALKADAGPELRQLNWFVGQWKFEGNAKAGPLGPAGKYVFTTNYQWFPGGDRIVCASSGTAPTGPFLS
jgi:hypothetical protein